MDKKEEICRQLSEIIKSKSVFTTLNKILKGESKNVYFELKGLLSLAVHICIEGEHNPGNNSYKELLQELNLYINKLIKKL